MKIRSVTNDISEKDSSGKSVTTIVRRHKKTTRTGPQSRFQSAPPPKAPFWQIVDQDTTIAFLKRVFLPNGYPESVTPDYLRYQVFNALQAFCNSLAGLLASRALLEGYGIGDPSASATNALLLNIVLDVCSRLTTIVSAHHLGSSLVPEAKKYRLLADILNDAALVLDTVSPVLNSYFGWPQLRIVALCLSASCRALCGIVAGGSKAAISLHFASPIKGKGDIGDLNAKDASKETVLALIGMLVGSLLVPRLTTVLSTYFTLFVLIGLHIGLNYMGVKALALRRMNHRRLWISWFLYDEAYRPTTYPTTPSTNAPAPPSTKSGSSYNKDKVEQHLFTPEMVNTLEPLFAGKNFTEYRDPITHRVLGHVTLGSSLSKILDRPLHPEVIASWQHAECIIWFDKKCLVYEDDPSGEDQDSEPTLPYLRPDVLPHVHVVYKDVDRCSKRARVRAWIAAGLLCKSITHLQDRIRRTKSDYKIETERLLRTGSDRSNEKADDEWAISPVVPSLLSETYRGSYVADYEPGWRNFRKRALELGWALSDEVATKDPYSSREPVADADDGEDGLVMPEPKYVLSGLGYSYATKKDV